MTVEIHPVHEEYQTEARARAYRQYNADFAKWAEGYGVIKHSAATQVKVHEMVAWLVESGSVPSAATAYTRLRAADRIASAAMWLVVHMTYADKVYTDGRVMVSSDFKKDPQGHTGGALNMAIGYVGYLAANALCGTTRGWIMGQGHCVAAIDAANLIMDNMSPEQAARYGLSDEGLTTFVRDFYSYDISPEGKALSPLGSHVGPHTAGGIIEGGYLGFAELLYPHMPLPGERLVAFLSDGAFEEQRGSDWAPRWWRAEDSGLVAPIMIANGRRIDQRSTMAQSGGVDWFRKHLALNGFDPIDIDGRDPASFAWAIFEIEARLAAAGDACRDGRGHYPVQLHYGIAETEKGFGFPGAGTNRAHNLPLEGSPFSDADARTSFNEGAAKLYVPRDDLAIAVRDLSTHEGQGRVKERDHPLAKRSVRQPDMPQPEWLSTSTETCSPMDAIDSYFSRIVEANPDLRVRVGNPDEMRSNNLNRTLDLLKHRVTAPEEGIAEAVDGRVITALNEEAVVCAALGNKGGLNLVCSYEAFAVKMLGALRQDLIFARNRKLAGQAPSWLGVPVVLTSHAWENGKNEQSHQDTTLAEAMLGEMSDVSRVVFPCDWNSAQVVLRSVYESRGVIWSVVAPKRPQRRWFSKEQAETLMRDSAVQMKSDPDARVLLTATGGYQLTEVLKASARLEEKGIPHAVNYLMEPGRFRNARDLLETDMLTTQEVREELFPASISARVFLTHTRAAPYLGTVRPLDTGPQTTHVLGYANRGGTLDAAGMLLANGCTFAHVLEKVTVALGSPLSDFLTGDEIKTLSARR